MLRRLRIFCLGWGEVLGVKRRGGKTGGKGARGEQRGEGQGKGRWKVEEKGRKEKGKRPCWGQNGRKKWPCISGCLSWVQKHWAERVDSQADLGWRVSSSAPRLHIHILPERLCIAYPSDSFALISEEAGRNAALKFAHWLLEYQLRLLGGFGRDLSSTTKSFPCVVEALPRACLRREAEPIRWDLSASKCVDV